MPVTRRKYSAFVPQGENRRETAQVLVRTARENGIDQRSIQSVQGGFNVTEELAEVLYEEPEEPTEETDKSVPATQTDPQTRKGKGDSTKTSGNRAGKNKDSQEE